MSDAMQERPAHGAGGGDVPDHPLLRVVAKLLLPVIWMFALYVQGHGEVSPGGGFSAGVIFATGFVLFALVFGVGRLREAVPPAVIESAMALGLLLFVGVGVATMLLGGRFLDYDALAGEALAGQHLGIVLVETAVGIAVAAVMVGVYSAFAVAAERGPSGR